MALTIQRLPDKPYSIRKKDRITRTTSSLKAPKFFLSPQISKPSFAKSTTRRAMDTLGSADEASDYYFDDPLGSYGDPETSTSDELESLFDFLNNDSRFFSPASGAPDMAMSQVPLLYNSSPNSSHLRSAVMALAMEARGLDTSDSELLSQAHAEYGRTLMKVREALGDPVESRLDETLVTIQLLCHFEVCTPPSEK